MAYGKNARSYRLRLTIKVEFWGFEIIKKLKNEACVQQSRTSDGRVPKCLKMEEEKGKMKQGWLIQASKMKNNQSINQKKYK